jgi:hypothetical protein
MLSVIMLDFIMLSDIMLGFILLTVILPRYSLCSVSWRKASLCEVSYVQRVILLSVIMLSAILQNVVAPPNGLSFVTEKYFVRSLVNLIELGKVKVNPFEHRNIFEM